MGEEFKLWVLCSEIETISLDRVNIWEFVSTLFLIATVNNFLILLEGTKD